jgi:integrase
MSATSTAKVTVTEKIRELPTGRRRFMVRWKVDGAPERTACFATRKAARAHQARLIAAVSAGELFDRGTREPVSWRTADLGPTIAEFVRDWIARNRDTWLPTTLRSEIEEAAAWLPALGTRQVAERAVVYAMLKTVLNPGLTPSRTQLDLWRRLVGASRPAGSLRRDHMDAALAACRTNLDGSSAAASYYTRRRVNLGQVLKDAVARDVLARNPLAGYKTPKAARPSPKVDVSEIGELEQVRQVLAKVAERSRKWMILFALMYYAGLRPSEAVIVRWRDLTRLPEGGWGELRVRKSAAEAGRKYTGTDHARQENGLKWREADVTRPVPLPPVLVALLRDWRTEGARPDDLVCPAPRGGPASATTIQRVWKAARNAVLGTTSEDCGVDPNCLHRPYSLRHSAASLWLGLGVPAEDVAERLGNSKAELWRTYADVLPSHREQANAAIGAALDAAAAPPAGTAGDTEDPASVIARLKAEVQELRAAADRTAA